MTFSSGDKSCAKFFRDAFSGEQQVTVLDRLYFAKSGRWRILLGHSAQGLALVRCECRNVDEPHNLRIVARFSDDGTTIGMTDEQNRAILHN